MTPDALRALLSGFGGLRPQGAADWRGEGPLPPDLLRFYEELGPYGEGEGLPSGLFIPLPGEDVWLPPLVGIWDLQAGYRWDTRTGRPVADWRPHWLVVAERAGDPLILDTETGAVLWDLHGRGAWSPVLAFPDLFAMATALAAAGDFHQSHQADMYDETFTLRPAWLAGLHAHVVALAGRDAAETVVRLVGE